MTLRAEPKPSGAGSVTAGSKTMVCCGVHYTTSTNNNRVGNCMFVCVEDNEQKGEESRSCWDGFPLIQSCVWRIENFSHAVGVDDPFDITEDKFREVAMGQPFMATVVMEKDRDGNDRPSIVRYERLELEGGFPDEWKAIADAGTKRFHEIVGRWGQRRSRNASQRTDQGGAPEGETYDDQDIPF